MQMTLDEFAARFPERAQPVPVEYAGRWVAWNDDQSEIIAHDSELKKVRQAATELGCIRPVFQRVPREPFVGGV